MSEPYVPQLIYYPERDEFEFVTEDVTTVERALTPDDSAGLLLRMEEPREVIGFRIAGDLVRRVSPLSDGDGWQAIETATKEDLIDIWTVGWGAGPLRVADCYYDDICDEWRSSRPAGSLMCIKAKYVTHWRHRPAPPRDEVK